MLLGSASGISAFGMAILVPNLDLIGRVYDATPAVTQFLVTAYTLGLALAQPVQGVLTDRFGRRPVMITGVAFFVASSLFCAFAQSLTGLIAGRFAQALGISVGTVVSRAIVRDLCDAEGTARALSVIAAALGIAPVVAPVLGGVLGAELGWRWSFVATAIMGASVLIAIALRLPETLSPSDRKPASMNSYRSDFAILLRSRSFLGFTLVYGFVSSAFFVFLAVGGDHFRGRAGHRPAGIWPHLGWYGHELCIGGHHHEPDGRQIWFSERIYSRGERPRRHDPPTAAVRTPWRSGGGYPPCPAGYGHASQRSRQPIGARRSDLNPRRSRWGPHLVSPVVSALA